MVQSGDEVTDHNGRLQFEQMNRPTKSDVDGTESSSGAFLDGTLRQNPRRVPLDTSRPRHIWC